MSDLKKTFQFDFYGIFGCLKIIYESRYPYTEATLLEVQRYATVVPLFSRCNIQDQQVGEYVIPKVIRILVK